MHRSRCSQAEWRLLNRDFEGENEAMARLTKYEKETVILTSEGDSTYSVYTFNPALKRRLADFARKYPENCRLEFEDKKVGSQSYVIDKRRLSIRLTAPYSEERRRAASLTAKKTWFWPLRCRLFPSRGVEKLKFRLKYKSGCDILIYAEVIMLL